MRKDANARVDDILYREHLLQEELRVVKEKLLVQGKVETGARARLEHDMAQLRHESIELKREREELRRETIELRREKEELRLEIAELKRQAEGAQRAWLTEKQALQVEAAELRREWQEAQTAIEQERLLRQQDIQRLLRVPRALGGEEQRPDLAHVGGGASIVSVGVRGGLDVATLEVDMGAETPGADGHAGEGADMLGTGGRSRGGSGLPEVSSSHPSISSRLVALRAQKEAEGSGVPGRGTPSTTRPRVAPVSGSNTEPNFMKGLTSGAFPVTSGSVSGPVSATWPTSASGLDGAPALATNPNDVAGGEFEREAGVAEAGGVGVSGGAGGGAGMPGENWAEGGGVSRDMGTGLGDLVFTKEDVDLFSDVGQEGDNMVFGEEKARSNGAALQPLAPPTSEEGGLGGRVVPPGFFKALAPPSLEDVHFDEWSFSLPAREQVTHSDHGEERMTEMLAPAPPTSFEGGAGVGVDVGTRVNGGMRIDDSMGKEMSHGHIMAGIVAPVSRLGPFISLLLFLSIPDARALFHPPVLLPSRALSACICTRGVL